MSIVICVLYFSVLAVLSAYGLHRAHLVYLCWRNRKTIASVADLAPRLPDAELPVVTVQLPIFNESTVVVRLLESVAAMDYPRDRLQIQVLDDSTDETTTIARREVEKLVRRGFDAEYVHRVDRVGYKAGALDNGLSTAKGNLVAIFDADFVCSPDFVRAIVGHFLDEKVGCVQARWAHLNRDASLLTQIQALMLDGHHMVENRARFGAALLFNFSGTGGMWRRQAIAEAGGWQHDTLTEDLDLSYRAQLKGWRFIYRPDVVSPAELPEDIAALRAQQHRWAKGTVQTARKLLRRVVAKESGLTLSQRIEAAFHMTPHFAYPLMVMLSLLLLPILLTVEATNWKIMMLIDLPMCMAPVGSLASFYMLAESAQGRSRLGAIKLLPALIALGAGLAPHLTAAVNDGLRSGGGEFVRTPKHGNSRGRYKAVAGIPIRELGLGLLSATSAVMALVTGHWFVFPFVSLFTLGYAYIAYLVMAEHFGRKVIEVAEAPASVDEDDADLANSGIRPSNKGRLVGVDEELAA
ncbi:MAG: glycosyltransferase [Deltaproteobacteria bacterium]|nr:glycosyltransferase [Deltaproteobacteria bacterium]